MGLYPICSEAGGRPAYFDGESCSEMCHEPLQRETVAHPRLEAGIARETLCASFYSGTA